MADGAHLKVAVLGLGGVGGFLAAILARAGCEVLVLAGEQTAHMLAHDGLRLESGRYGSFDVRVRSTERLSEAVDSVLVTVKATQLEGAIERVAPGELGDAIVVPFLNGLEHVDRLRALYQRDSVVAATIRIETTRVRPGLIRHTSPFAAVDLAPAPANRERVDRLAEALRAAGVDVRARDDEKKMLWDKFAVLEPMALLTTHMRASIGPARSQRREDLVGLVREVAAVASADGAPTDADRVLGFIDSVPESMESSMQRDDAAGRPLELDALGGALIRRAERTGVDVPVTRRIAGDLAARRHA
jgi:2-dehydropantoate 2-reductase